MTAPLGKLGAYELLRELGRGGMGTVYEARHLPTGALRAVKVIAASGDAEMVARFRREGEALARIGAGTVPVHETGVDRGRYFLVMGLMRGGSLRSRLKERGRLEWREAAPIVASLARTLARCHDAGLVHRDLKPDNVLFDDEGRPLLADFGLARDLDAASLTETGAVLGTPAYMAPEQLEGKPATASADVYALGIVLHELVCGEPPFARDSAVVHQFKDKVAGRKTRLADLAPGTPRELDAIVDRALSGSCSAAGLARALDDLLAGRGARRSRLWIAAPIALAGLAVASFFPRERRPGRDGIVVVASLSVSSPVEPTARATPAQPAQPKNHKPATKADHYEAERLASRARAKLGIAPQDLEGALADIRRAIELEPTPAKSRTLAEVLFAAGRSPEALPLVDELLASGGEESGWARDYRPRVESAMLASTAHDRIFQSRLDEAIQLATRSIELDGQNVWGWAFRGEALTKAGRLDDAVRDLDIAIGLQPLSHPLACRARVRLLRGDRDGAIADVDSAVQLDSQPWVRVARAEIRRKCGDLDGAIADVNDAIRRESGDVVAQHLTFRAELELDQGDGATALQDIREVETTYASAKIETPKVRAYGAAVLGSRSEALRKKRDATGALEAAELALRLQENGSSRRARARSLVALGRFDEAMSDYDRAYQLAPDLDTFAERARVRFDHLDRARAMAEATKLTELAPQGEWTWRFRAELEVQNGEPEAALRDAEKAASLGGHCDDPGSPEQFFVRAYIVAATDVHEARRCGDAGVERAHEAAWAYAARAVLRARLGAIDNARGDAVRAGLDPAFEEWARAFNARLK